MSLKIPPPLVMVVHMLLVWLVARFVPDLNFDFPFQRDLVLILGVAGVAFAMVAMGLFRRAKTTVDPLNPEKAEHLVTTGVYRITRNPMYLGLILILLAWIIMKGNPLNLIFLITCMGFLTKFQIKPEEEALSARFGAAYSNYRAKVRRWI